ncbi:MAG TPA: DNA topoisomerase VI subunit B [Candidatus Polarisedimenticolia bacterium]|nr:DNA topoisomerase VI subunit B [Candidatus Polarisedimenticolia bacterium]
MAKSASPKPGKGRPAPRRGAAIRTAAQKSQMKLFADDPSPAPAAAAPATGPAGKGRRGSGRRTGPAALPSLEPAAPIPAGAPVAPVTAGQRRRETAESMASRQREISVSEFFTKNRHLLGFDNPAKALLTAIKEAVDNSLDACEEAGILPDLRIAIREVGEERYRITVEDNGPGIVKQQVPRIFGKLLYGSKFHVLKQSRGQQGIGISAAGMYSQLTTGKPVRIVSRTGKGKPAHFYEIHIDTRKNAPEVLREGTVEWPHDHGTSVEMELQATYKKGRRSVDDYVAQTALANPHAAIGYTDPKGETVHHPRLTESLPHEPVAIKPHPYGVELGFLIKMLKETRARNLRGALQGDFSRVSGKVADEIAAAAGLRPEARPQNLQPDEVERLFKAIPGVRIMSPPTNCLSPIGEQLIRDGLAKMVPECDFYTSITRSPAVYRGNPFQIEAGLAYGGPLPADDLIDLWRFANRVPLQYQQAACAITRSVVLNDWKNYGLAQSRGALPAAPMVLFVHMASAWVPFTSESKEAIASYPEIVKEIRLALQECGRRLGGWIRHRRREEDAEKKRSYIEKYIPHIGIALREILGFPAKEEARVVETLKDTLERSRAI